MVDKYKLEEEVAQLECLIEAQVKRVQKKLETTQKTADLESEAAELSRLIQLRRFKTQMLERISQDEPEKKNVEAVLQA